MLRDLDEHLDMCNTLETDEDNYVENSKEFGVNSRSILLERQHFDLCSGVLIPDIMHDLFEGRLGNNMVVTYYHETMAMRLYHGIV